MIDGNVIINVDTPASNSQGIAIVAPSNGGDFLTRLAITNNSIVAVDDEGIYINGNITKATVSGN